MCKSFFLFNGNHNNSVENARARPATRCGRAYKSEWKKLYFNKHFFILYVYVHLNIYALDIKGKFIPANAKHGDSRWLGEVRGKIVNVGIE